MNSGINFNLKEIIGLCIGGNEIAFKELFNHLNDRLFKYALRHMPDREGAMDIVQEVFIDLWKSLRKFQYKSDGEFYAFAYLITKKKISKYYKLRKPTTVFNEKYVKGNYEIQFKDYRKLVEWTGKLKSKYQELLKLRYWADMTFKDISFALQISENKARVWHYRAIKKLKKIANKHNA